MVIQFILFTYFTHFFYLLQRRLQIHHHEGNVSRDHIEHRQGRRRGERMPRAGVAVHELG